MKKSEQILIIDDAIAGMPGSLSAVGDILSKMDGMVVETFSPLISGYPQENFNWYKYDIIFFDGDMDRMQNFRILKQCGQKNGFPYAVVCTSYEDNQERELFESLGVNEIALKHQINYGYLNTLIRRALLDFSAVTFAERREFINRKFIRHSSSDISFEYKLSGHEEYLSRMLTDISQGGLRFSQEHPLKPGDVVKIKITAVKPEFEADGVVVWCYYSQGYYETGIEFKDEFQTFSAKMVEQLCHSRGA